MAPKKFLWVNKNARSTTLSRAEADETMGIFRHIQEHIQWTKTEQTRRPVETDGPLALSPSTLRIINSPRLLSSCTLEYPSAKKQMWKADAFRTAESWPVGGVTTEGVTSTDMLSQGHTSPQQHGAMTPIPTLHRPICGKDEGIDAFNCTSIPITQTVHQLLMYFESLWFPRTLIRLTPSASLTSSGHQVMQECIFDSLQMNCVLASAESRLKNFHAHSIKGGSKQYFERAVRLLRQRLSNEANLDSKYIYAIVRLYVAEAYRGNLNEALIHLNGARAAYNRLDPRTALDSHYTSTLCGMSEASLLPKVWETPATFPTIADPGLARVCFSDEVLQEYLGHQEETAQSLLAYLGSMTENRHGSRTLQEIVIDMIEYAAVRRNMASREYLGQPISVAVTQWAHLRRFAFVSRLMSIDAVKNPLFHAIRVALVIWLAIAVDFTGFERHLEIVVMHLRDIMRSISLAEMARHADVTAWILLLGAVVGSGGTRLYFVEVLADSDVLNVGFDTGMERWFDFLENTSKRCLYCQTIQRQSLVELAKELYLYRYHLLVGAG